jgi:hypothetical protein
MIKYCYQNDKWLVRVLARCRADMAPGAVCLGTETKKPRHGIAVMAGLSNAIWVEQRSWRAGRLEPPGQRQPKSGCGHDGLAVRDGATGS